MTKNGNLFSLQGKSALITGATGHLGQAMAYALAEAGAHILVNSRKFDHAQELVDRLIAENYSAEPLVFDVAEESQTKEALDQIAGEPLHVLINNAYAGGGGTILTSESDQYRQSFEITLVAAHNLLLKVLPALKLGAEQSGDVSVINVASMYGLVSPDLRVYGSDKGANSPFYGAAKAALIQWTRYAACELAPQGIRVNSISPGPFPSDDVKQTAPDFVERLAKRVPIGRVGIATEIQGPVLFLASPAASYVNGANLVVDGGWTIW